MTLIAPVAARHAFSKRERDPLADFRCRSWAQRALLQSVSQAEVYWRSGNSGGKTLGGAALGVALARGVRRLDGIDLPRLVQPTVGWVLSRSYKQQVHSVQRAYLNLIGRWPHEIGWVNRGLGHIGLIRVRPNDWDDDDPETWSQIVFASQENKDVAVGVRIDWCHGDEPPVEEVWREIRARSQAGRQFILFITATPEKRSEWWWLEEDFAGCRGEIKRGRLLLQSSIYDNQALAPAEIKQIEERWRGDRLLKARLYGEPVDTTGDCPFDPEILDRWAARCYPGEREKVAIQTKRDGPQGRQRVAVNAEVEVWIPPDPLDLYYVNADLASGVKSSQHDPLGLHVWSRRRRALALRYNGYLHPYGMGWLAGILAKRYTTKEGPPLVDPERNGGWFDQFVEGLHECGQFTLSRDFDRASQKWSTKLGFATGKDTRDEIIAAIERAMLNDDCGIWSADVVSCLAQCIVDPNEKILAGPGKHDEDLILSGRALHVISRRLQSPRIEKQPEGVQRFRELLARQFGRDVLGDRIAADRRGPAERWSRAS